jgi:hypothetical protein
VADVAVAVVAVGADEDVDVDEVGKPTVVDEDVYKDPEKSIPLGDHAKGIDPSRNEIDRWVCRVHERSVPSPLERGKVDGMKKDIHEDERRLR